MKLVEETNPILRKKCTPFDFNDPVMDPYELVDALHKMRREGRGIGLAAPQVNIDSRVLVIGMGNFDTEGTEDFNQCFFNPKIISTDGQNTYMIEGCLSFPELFVKVKRPENITLEWYSEEGSVCNERFTGITSRIIQHELDHLDGITFLQRATRFHLEKAKKNRKYTKRRREKLDEKI